MRCKMQSPPSPQRRFQPYTRTRVRGLSQRGLVLGGKPCQLGQGEDGAVPADVAAADVAAAAHPDGEKQHNADGEATHGSTGSP